MGIEERLEELRTERYEIRKQADDFLKSARRLRKQADMVSDRIKGIEEALRLLTPPTVHGEPVPWMGNGEAKPPRRPRRDIKGMVQAALDGGAIRDIASLAIQLECRPSQVESALARIPELVEVVDVEVLKC